MDQSLQKKNKQVEKTKSELGLWKTVVCFLDGFGKYKCFILKFDKIAVSINQCLNHNEICEW